MKIYIKLVIDAFLYGMSFACLLYIFFFIFVAKFYGNPIGDVTVHFNRFNEMEIEFWVILIALILQISYGIKELYRKYTR